MDRLAWTSCLLILLSCISTTNTVYGHELSEGLELMNDEAVKIQGDAAFPAIGDPASMKADITYLVHANKGAKKSEIEDLVNFLKSLLTHANIASGDVRVALAFYKQNIRVNFDFNTYSTKAEVLDALDLFKESKVRSPKANVAAALKSLPRLLLNENKGNRADAKNYIILVTDLEATIKKNIETNAKILKNSGAEILTVGVGLPDSAELRTIASEPSGLHSFFVDDYASLSSVTSNILNMIPPLDDVSALIPTVPVPSKPANPRVYTTASEAPSPTQPDRVEVPTNSPEVDTPEPATLPPTAPPPPPPTTAPPPLPPTTTAEPILEPVVTSAEPPVSEIEDETTEIVTQPPLTEKPIPPRKPETPSPEIPKTIFTFEEIEECHDAKLDIVFVLDTSTSMTEPNFIKILAFLKSFLSEAPIYTEGVRVGVLTYSTDVKIQFHLNEFMSKEEVFAAIDKIPYNYGSTNTAGAINTMHNIMFHGRNGDREDAPNMAFVITDGVSNVNSFKTIDEAEAAKKDGIHIYAIGIGLADTRELNKIASAPFSKNRFIVREFDELDRLQSKLFEKLCPAATPPPEPIGECQPATADVVIMIDTSTSVGEANFKKTINFIKHFLAEADIDRGAVRVGVAIYSTSVFVKFNLDEYSTKDEVFDALEMIQYRYGSTNIAHAFRVMRTRMFTVGNGDRPDVKNIGIIITDGISNYEHYETVPQARLTQDAGIHVYAIGIGLADTKELEQISSQPAEENMFLVRNFDELDVLSYKVFEPYCPVPIKTEPPTEPPVVDTTTEEPEPFVETTTEEPEPIVEITTTEPALIVETTTEEPEPIVETTTITEPEPVETTTPEPEPVVETVIITEPEPVETTTTAPQIIAECHAAMADIVFLVDTSTSVSEANFRKIINFIKHFLTEADIDRGAVRVGVAIYSTSVYVQFDLNDYSTKEDVFAALDKIQYRYGSTNIAHAFRVMRTRMFTVEKGDRPETRNIGIIITDGVSNIEHYETVPQARLVQNAGIHVYAIGVGLADTTELERISSSPSEENTFIVQNFDELDVLMYKVFEKFCPGKSSEGVTSFVHNYALNIAVTAPANCM